MNVNHYIDRTSRACESRKWNKSWGPGGCYLHLEVSEFIEALRGKGNPVEEAADVLVAFFALLGAYEITEKMLESALKEKLGAIERFEVGDGKR
jgi:hypothetical protein